MCRALLMAPLALVLLILACPVPEDPEDPADPADGESGEDESSWIERITATDIQAPATAPDPKPVPAEDVEAPGGE